MLSLFITVRLVAWDQISLYQFMLVLKAYWLRNTLLIKIYGNNINAAIMYEVFECVFKQILYIAGEEQILLLWLL